MTELQRVTEAFTKERDSFEAEEATLKQELVDAGVAHERARSFLTSHQDSRKHVLGKVYDDYTAAMQAARPTT